MKYTYKSISEFRLKHNIVNEVIKLYDRIKEMREDRDIKQSTLAKYLGVHQTTYSSYEIGKLSLTADVLVKLAKYYNTSVDYLLGLTDDTKPFPKSRQ